MRTVGKLLGIVHNDGKKISVVIQRENIKEIIKAMSRIHNLTVIPYGREVYN